MSPQPEQIDTLYDTYDKNLYKLSEQQSNTVMSTLNSDPNADQSGAVMVDPSGINSGPSTASVTDTSKDFLSYYPTAGGTINLNGALVSEHRVQLPAGNVTLGIQNVPVGKRFIVSITQDSVGSRTVTWFPTIRWVDGAPPLLTSTPSVRDTFGFINTGIGTFDGFIIGTNI